MKNLKISKNKGFSLVELLVVIAVIGVIAAIAIPAMSNIFGNSEQAKAKRNAQNIASTYAASRAAGADYGGTTAGYIGAAADLADITTTLNAGINGQGNFATSRFQVVLDAAEVTDANAYLSYSAATDVLTYTGTSGN